MKTLKKLANNGRGVFEDTCDEYRKTLQDRPYYISELRDAFVDGCNAVTQEQHELALPFAEEYISKKSADVVYVSMDIERAYREGAKKMAEEYQKSRALITARRVRKAARLICAGSQLMSIANNFNKEAEGLVSNEFKQTKISNIYSEMQELFAELSTKFKQWNDECANIFLNLSSDDCVRWGEEGEKIEYQVRRIMEIDK